MLALGALLVTACSSSGGSADGGQGDGGHSTEDSASSTVDAGAPRIELGTGEIEFQPIEPGSELEYVLGAQGGWHFFGSVRVSGVEAGNPEDRSDPDNPITRFRVFRDSTRVDKGGAVYQQGLDPVPGQPGTFQMIGRRVILDLVRCGELQGVEVRFEVEVEDTRGVELQDSRTVTAVNAPRNDCN
jgi:hypothetical protein